MNQLKKYVILLGNIILGLGLFFLILIGLNILLNNLLPQMDNINILLAPSSFIIVALMMGKLNNRNKNWEYGWKEKNKSVKFLLGAIISMAIVTIASILILLTHTVELQKNLWQNNEILFQLIVFFMVAIGEEMFFRGFIYGASKKVVSTRGVIFINAALFAGIHLINAGATEQPLEFIGVGMINIILITVIFTQSRVYSQSLWMPIGLHFLFNVTQSCFFGFINGGKEATSIFKLEYMQPSVLNGGMFGMEASLILTPILIITIICYDGLWKKYIKI